jgi:hypothetical protein
VCKTWCLTLRDENRPSLRVTEIRALRIFRPKREEVIGGWRKLHIDEYHNLFSSLNRPIITAIESRMRGEWHIARIGKMKKYT